MEALTVREIAPAAAAPLLAGMERLDPRGLMAPQDVERMAHDGRCFAVTGPRASAIYVLHVRNGCAWVAAARGEGDMDVTAVLDELMTQQAAGLDALACQTARPGLVRKLQRRGWRVTGWVLRKELT
ncbi:MAG TPA: hypothetical protein VNO84_11635 [Burkholderiaceae bacterium]|nr:hypothetical protein [Burkholderiaceae bacterium]